MSSQSLLRQRSRETFKPEHDGNERRTPCKLNISNDGSPPASFRKKWTTWLFFLVSVTVITYFLLTGLGNSGGFKGSPAIDVNVAETDEDFLLHPEKHVFRSPTTITRQWNITRRSVRPDGVLKTVFMINDLFPGPTLEVRSGDRVVVEVKNALHDQGISIHWHGLSMRGANHMDGAVGITQQPIPPGDTFVYDFTIADEESGTFWYHAHDGVQRADGLYGGLVVHKPLMVDPKQQLRDERLLLVGDWYHQTGQEALEYFSRPGAFGNEAVPDSLLLHGRGIFNCSDAVPARPLDCQQKDLQDLKALNIDRAEDTLLRVVNVGSYASIALEVEYAHLLPVAVDASSPVDSQYTTKIRNLHPGERVDVMVESNKNGTHDGLLTVSMIDEFFKYDNAALTLEHHFPLQWHGSSSREVSAKPTADLDLTTLTSRHGTTPSEAQEIIILYTTTQKLSRLENQPLGFINSTTWKPMTTPLLDLPRSQWDSHQFVPPSLKLNTTIDIILNNLDEEPHPFHLHGHSFHILSTYSSTFNWGSYNPYDDEQPPGGRYNIVNPLRKDTVVVPRRGYAVLRFVADNPGIWMFHCHVLWHQASGMAMAFEIR